MGAGELPAKGRYAERQRNDHIMQLLHPELLLLDSAAAPEAIPDWQQMEKPRTLALEALQADVCEDIEAVPLNTDMSDLPALCYQLTGGTTGSSKCVRVSHEMALHEFEAYAKVFKDLSSKDRVLQHTPVLWAASAIGQINIAVSVGASICIAGMDQDSISRHGVTILGTVPSALQSINPQAVPTVRHVFCWGESMSPVLAAQWKSEQRRVIELLISTEYWLSLYSEGQISPEGRPIYSCVPGAELAVLQDGKLCTECGATGQLCLRGPMVTIVSQNPLHLEFRGRSDMLVKVGGQFVDLAEVELRLCPRALHPGLGSCSAFRSQGEDAATTGADGKRVRRFR
ncbi:redM [Symbiodinium microadriaticum]|nr:redM [Symbiodinium microadriaticum]